MSSSYKQVPDPFSAKRPIPAGAPGFYELDEVFINVLNLLRAGESISLVGERKAGKTSFLNYLLIHLPADEFIPIFIDMQRILPQNDRVFLGRLSREAARAIEPIVNLVEPIKMETLTIEPDGKIYEAFENDLELLRIKLPLNENGQKRRLVWLIDEIEALQSYEKSGLATFIRPLAQSDPDFRLVVAGYDVLYTFSNWSEWSPFFNAFRPIRLEGLNPVAARQLIEDALAAMTTTLEEHLYQSLFDWTGRKPFFLKWILSKIAHTLNQRKANYQISTDVLDAAQKLFLDEQELGFHFSHLWDKHTTSSQRIVLSVIASQSGPYNHPTILNDLKDRKLNQGDKQATQHLIDDLTRLQQLGFLYARAGEYTFTSACLKIWIAKTKPLD